MKLKLLKVFFLPFSGYSFVHILLIMSSISCPFSSCLWPLHSPLDSFLGLTGIHTLLEGNSKSEIVIVKKLKNAVFIFDQYLSFWKLLYTSNPSRK